MDRSSRLHLSLAAILLASMYFYLLVAVIGWTIGSHTLAVVAAALPIAIAITFVARNYAMNLAFAVALLGTALAVVPSLNPSILHTSGPNIRFSS